jgi:predicted nicotinamide N-methyase
MMNGGAYLLSATVSFNIAIRPTAKMSSNPSRPVHPTARAFFHALDDSSNIVNDSFVKSEKIRKQTQTLGWRSRHSQAEWYPFVVSGRSLQVCQVQRGEVEGTFGTGATVWPASMVLLKYLERNPQVVDNKTIIDLGAGTAITSIAAAVLGAKRVVCTDGTESVVKLAQENVNQVPIDISSKIHVRKYCWGDGSDKKTIFDVVLVSDCVLPKLYPIAPLVKALDDLMGDDSVALLSYEHRYYQEYDPRSKFRELATRRGLDVHVVPLSEQDSIYSVDDIEIWKVRRKS